jgi:hypothetical protein
MLWFRKKLNTISAVAEECKRNGVVVDDFDGLREKQGKGPLDDIPSGLCYRRNAISGIMQVLFPSYGCCGRCHFPWSLVRLHLTPVGNTLMFALCEDCWSELQTPEHRAPYYREVFNKWMAESRLGESEWPAIQSAVFHEGGQKAQSFNIH